MPSSATQTDQPRDVPETPDAGGISRLRSAAASILLRMASVLDARPFLSLILLLAIFLPAELQHSLNKPLWHDELFTFYISQTPSLRVLLRDMHAADLNPPLTYLLTRASFAVFGPNTLSARLPEIAGFALAMLALFEFVRRRAGTLYGLLASTLLYTGVAQQMSVEARPYGLLLGFGALSLLAWQLAWEKKPIAIPLLLIGGFGMLLSHVFGVYVWAALAAAEAVRIAQSRHIDWAAAVAWLLPILSFALYLPLIHMHATGLYPTAFQPTTDSIFNFYITRIEREFASLMLTALAILLLVGPRGLQGRPGWFLTHTEWVSTILIIATPVVLIAQLMRSHASFFERYGTTASLGISILAAILLARWTGRDLRAALLCILIALLTSAELPFAIGAVLDGRIFKSTEPIPELCGACALTAQLNPSLPLVDASGLTFVEMDHREDTATLSRVFYLTDPAAAAEYAHANIFDEMAHTKSLFGLRANVSPYADFISLHHDFFVLGNYNYPEDWLLRKLQADGATLRMLGHTSGSYSDHDLYEITFDARLQSNRP